MQCLAIQFIYKTISFNRFIQYIFYFDNKHIGRNTLAFEKLGITHSDLNANINISHFKPEILEAIDHLKGISHKCPDVDAIFDFITRGATSNITKEALADKAKYNYK